VTYVVRHEACPRCRKNGRDRTGDNLAVYSDDSCHCFSCSYTVPSQAWLEENGYESWVYEDSEEVTTKEKITPEELEKIKSYTGLKGFNTRGIKDETYKAYLVRHKYSEETGEPTHQYYGVTEDGQASGFKVKKLPKEFSVIGKNSKESDLFGQWKWRNSVGKFVVLTAGELDCLSAYQMLEEYRQFKNGEYESVPCVSSTIGETGSYKQVAKHYEWFDRFDKIIVCYDNDRAGKEALEDLVTVLPKGKMYVMELPLKDTNKMLEEGKQKLWIDLFWKAKLYTPDGIIGSGDLMSKIIEQANTPKIPLPPFMHKLEDMMAGGIPLGVIVNLGSASGTGKSTIVEEMVYHWIFHSPHMIGVVTLESDSGQYGTKLLSRHVGVKIDLIETVEEKLEYLRREDIVAASEELFHEADGSQRFYLIEDRDGGIDSMKKKIEELIITCECKVIILDPLQDILDGLSNEDQAIFMKWMKGMIKSHGVTFINVSHVRKSGGDKKANSVGADMFEEDMQGSSSIFKSGACNLLFSRNKEAEDEIERNTTKMKASKIRWTGRTGIAGEYYYDIDTHTIHDKEEYLRSKGGEF
jgi:archaellum biogenesis ATPase FlaH